MLYNYHATRPTLILNPSYTLRKDHLHPSNQPPYQHINISDLRLTRWLGNERVRVREGKRPDALT